MNTKLTLSLNKEIIEQAKAYANAKGTSLSKLVEDFLALKLQMEKEKYKKLDLDPWLKDMSGMVKSDNDHLSYKELRDFYRSED